MTRAALFRFGVLFFTLCGLSACASFRNDVSVVQEERSSMWGEPLPYKVGITTTEGQTVTAEDTATAEESESDRHVAASASATIGGREARTLISEMRSHSQLVQLQNEPPDSRVGLERRIVSDVETAVKLLRSQGYYSGTARYAADWDVRPVSVDLILEPGPLYVIGATTVVYESGDAGSAQTAPPEGAPCSLADVGLPDGSPAVADVVTAAVNKVPTLLQTRGYPYARVQDTRYVVDRAAKTLDAAVAVVPGRYAEMDGVLFTGAEHVSRSYLEKLIPWESGQAWDAERLSQYRDILQQTGLFRSITVKPAQQADDKHALPVDVTLTEAAPRTVSGGIRYASDVGLGVQGAWEHRNFFGSGELLRVALPLAQERQELSVSFTKPAFGRRDQSLFAEAALRNEETDAYDQTAAYGAVGLERKLSPHWWASAGLSGEGGTLDQGDGRKKYFLVGVPFNVRRDTSDSLLNPTRGTRLQVTATPYVGAWNNAFSTLRLRVDGSGYYAPWGNDDLVLAARVAAGSMSGSSLNDIPGSIRFYAGGGGSVRGYKYQSLGAHDADGDPVGGLSFNELSLEARFKITDTIGLVPFVDGGMVYEDSMPHWGKDMAWAVGLGLRYFTAIGPVRADFAVPLEDREGQKAFQFYISIGQAF